MQFLWTAAHEVLEFNPALSSFYLSQIQSDKNVCISKSLIRRFCTHCSTLFIPGVTCQVEIKSIKTKKNNKKNKIKRKDSQNIYNNEVDVMDEDEKPNNICKHEKLYYSLEDKNDNFQYYKYSNVVKYTCNICRKETIFNGTPNNYKLEKPSLETIDEEMEMNLPSKISNKRSSTNVNSPIPNRSRTNSNSSTVSLQSNTQNKNKKRKRNKNDLQQLLSKSNENKKPRTYSLNDFLSNL
ncbi:hypothetical protein PIROE2DRAFT_17118 [Piromyces sp. E2]|nr:hypothetical protein PIROE2DRAFT_17118 [Piromyces sp. E2]|eukprot:OUM57782.1 hypothetical protein PIROE2DRAFT_17118 [Piromyces sp. E2]